MYHVYDELYNGDNRTRQVNTLRTLAADLADGVDVENYGGNVGACASDAVEYYIEEGNHIMPQWFDEHDHDLLVRFVTEAIAS